MSLIGGMIVGAVVGAVGKVVFGGPVDEKSGKVQRAVEAAIKAGVVGSSCWDWIAEVFKRSGLWPSGKKFYEVFWYPFRGSQYVSSAPSKFLHSEEYCKVVKPGDWIYIHNRNRFDSKGNHSVIFLGWEDQDCRKAKVASSPFAGKEGRIELRDLVDQPIAFIIRLRG